ncbi:MAG: hypothetical protein CSA09_04450 [Candidatus Contendobacter odensis]|uniref:DUF4390 domain-containing protein n=1 Tax=Candidatus Contendibacter odensensis TaxID=1400860 RepID=A0A2G6PEH6_9GAMM|nr:MAG: hypothetical protein CSA09_04450 [Candidatus Contendobacter odensis]
MIASGTFRLIPGLVLLLGLLSATTVRAAGFEVRSASTYLSGNVYHLNAVIKYRFSKAALDALSNGVPLVIELRMGVRHRRSFMWDKTIFSLSQRFELSYHPLSQQYLVTNLNSGERHGFPSLALASKFMGDLHDFPFLDKGLLPSGKGFIGALQARLDLESLPAPLRLFAYISEDWHLSSKWYTWLL